MSMIKLEVTQTVLNTPATGIIPTGLTVDGRSGWNIQGIKLLFENASACVTQVAKCTANIQLNTEAGSQGFTDNDSITFMSYQFQGIAASTSAHQIFPVQQEDLIIPRTTVQPNLFVFLNTTGMVATASFGIVVFYEIIKLTDLEVMRLMQGGA
jgi:hypothetical protein